MIKASDLVRQQKEKENLKNNTFDKVYSMIEKKIQLASAAGYYQAWHEIPQFIIGSSLYSLSDCEKYVQNKLKENGFKTKLYDPNLLFITWEN